MKTHLQTPDLNSASLQQNLQILSCRRVVGVDLERAPYVRDCFVELAGLGEGGGGYIPADATATPAGDFPTSPTDDDIPF